MNVIEKSRDRYKAIQDNFYFILWVDNEDSNGQWFIRVFDENAKAVFFEGWWADSVGKTVDEAISFVERKLNEKLSKQ